MFLVILVIFVVSLIAWYQNKYRYRNALLAKIPAPYKYPLMHNTPEFYGKPPKELFNWLEEAHNKHGPVYQFTLEPFDNGTFVVSDVKVAEGILSSQKLLDKGDDYELLKNWLGTGLLISTGKKWFQRRKIITPAFHFQILERFVEIMDEQGKVLVEKLEKFDGQQVDIYPFVNLYALDVICECAMGCKMNSQNEDSDYVKAVKTISELVFERSFDTIRRVDFIYRFTELYRQEQKLLKVLHGFTDSVIKARRDELLNKFSIKDDASIDDFGVKEKKALLDILLQATVDGKPLTNMDIREEVDTFMFEGHDTTTSGISFCLYNIAKYPEVQKKIYDEIQNEIGEHETVLSLQVLNKLHYLELVIKESLRLYPSVPYFARKLSEEFTAGGYTFPKGSNVTVSPYLMGRDENIFPDPLDFKPERFDIETTSEKVNPFSYVPFSAGPRNCIGQKFAVFELKSIVCKIVKNFELKLPASKAELQVYSDLVLKPIGGINVEIKKR